MVIFGHRACQACHVAPLSLSVLLHSPIFVHKDNKQNPKLCLCGTGELGRETKAESQSRTGPTWESCSIMDLWVSRSICQHFMAFSVSITVFPVGERSLVRDNDNILLFAPPRDKWMQETKLLLEPPTPLSIPPILTRVGPGAGLGEPKGGGLKRKRPGGWGSWPKEEKLSSWIWSPLWNIITWIKKLGPHLQTSCPSPLRPVTHFLLSYVTLKDQGRDCAIRGQIKKISFSSLPPPQGCCVMCHIPSNEKL